MDCQERRSILQGGAGRGRRGEEEVKAAGVRLFYYAVRLQEGEEVLQVGSPIREKNSQLVIVFVCLDVDNMWEDQQWSAMHTSTSAHHSIVTSTIYDQFISTSF